MENRNFRKNDIILISGLFTVFLIIILVLQIFRNGGNKVLVSVDGVEKYTFDLDKDIEFEIEGYEGGTNHLVIKDGEAYLTEASCPDHICVYMGKISDVGQSIICLPNRVVVEIVGDKNSPDGDIDTIVR
jgi:hypothetical protein